MPRLADVRSASLVCHLEVEGEKTVDMRPFSNDVDEFDDIEPNAVELPYCGAQLNPVGYRTIAMDDAHETFHSDGDHVVQMPAGVQASRRKRWMSISVIAIVCVCVGLGCWASGLNERGAARSNLHNNHHLQQASLVPAQTEVLTTRAAANSASPHPHAVATTTSPARPTTTSNQTSVRIVMTTTTTSASYEVVAVNNSCASVEQTLWMNPTDDLPNACSKKCARLGGCTQFYTCSKWMHHCGICAATSGFQHTSTCTVYQLTTTTTSADYFTVAKNHACSKYKRVIMNSTNASARDCSQFCCGLTCTHFHTCTAWPSTCGICAEGSKFVPDSTCTTYQAMSTATTTTLYHAIGINMSCTDVDLTLLMNATDDLPNECSKKCARLGGCTQFYTCTKWNHHCGICTAASGLAPNYPTCTVYRFATTTTTSTTSIGYHAVARRKQCVQYTKVTMVVSVDIAHECSKYCYGQCTHFHTCTLSPNICGICDPTSSALRFNLTCTVYSASAGVENPAGFPQPRGYTSAAPITPAPLSSTLLPGVVTKAATMCPPMYPVCDKGNCIIASCLGGVCGYVGRQKSWLSPPVGRILPSTDHGGQYNFIEGYDNSGSAGSACTRDNQPQASTTSLPVGCADMTSSGFCAQCSMGYYMFKGKCTPLSKINCKGCSKYAPSCPGGQKCDVAVGCCRPAAGSHIVQSTHFTFECHDYSVCGNKKRSITVNHIVCGNAGNCYPALKKLENKPGECNCNANGNDVVVASECCCASMSGDVKCGGSSANQPTGVASFPTCQGKVGKAGGDCVSKALQND